MADYTVWSDGGCLDNPGQMYGSYQLSIASGKKKIIRLKFGNGTNNQAEYLSLISAIQEILALCRVAQVPPSKFSVDLFTDSQLVVKQINNEWNCSNEKLQELKDQASRLLSYFGSFSVVWKPRKEVVKILGH